MPGFNTARPRRPLVAGLASGAIAVSLALALGLKACERGFNVRVTTVQDLAAAPPPVSRPMPVTARRAGAARADGGRVRQGRVLGLSGGILRNGDQGRNDACHGQDQKSLAPFQTVGKRRQGQAS